MNSGHSLMVANVLMVGLSLCACSNHDAAPRDAGSAGAAGKDASAADAASAGVGSQTRGDASVATQHDADMLGVEDAGSADAGSLGFKTSRIQTGPTYKGTVNAGADCSMAYATTGFAPVDVASARHPLFLYFVGTAFVSPDKSASYDSMAALKVTEAMARRGFVALSVAYDNTAAAWLSDHKNQLACLFDAQNPENLLDAVCAWPNVDCDAGIATWGHSQGAYVAIMAANFESRVRATWTTGYGGDANAVIALDRVRVVNGEADTSNGMASTLNMITGLTPTDCPDPDQCLRVDGSGWIIVRKSQLADPDKSSADHCWFDRQHCTDSAIILEPNWIDPESKHAFALELNADWVAHTALRK